MLTIKPPIRLAVQPTMIKMNNSMTERMEANYKVFVSSLTPECMIHLVTGSPELYIEGDSITSLTTINSKINRQEINIELVNNVLNRLLVANQHNMNYQDRVFVDMVLSRIGITDVKQFVENVSVLKQNTQNTNALLQLYREGDNILRELNVYQKAEKEKKKDSVNTGEKESVSERLWLHQQIMNRLQTGDIYKEMYDFSETLGDITHHIDGREMHVSEQMMQSQNIMLHQIKKQYAEIEEPIEYRVLNQYEMGESNRYEVKEAYIENEWVKAVMLNAINSAYALRYETINAGFNVWYDMLDTIQYVTENTLNRFEAYHVNQNMTEQEVEQYNRWMYQKSQNEIVALRQLYDNYETNLTWKQENVQVTEEAEYIKQHNYGQQLNYLTEQELNLKQQLQLINQTNIKKQEQLEQVLGDLKQAPGLKINKAKALADVSRTLENPEAVMLEYNKTQNRVEQYETETNHKLEQVFDRNVHHIFEMLEQYRHNPEFMREQITRNEAALELLIHDSKTTVKEENQQIEQIVEKKSENHITKQREQEIRTQLQHLIKKEPGVKEQIRRTAEVEMLHKVTETEANEEMLEEIRNVNRSIARNEEIHKEITNDRTDIFENVTNHINQVQLQQNDVLTNMIASNVKEQLGDLSEQVYRKLEKRMDTEKRRRGF